MHAKKGHGRTVHWFMRKTMLAGWLVGGTWEKWMELFLPVFNLWARDLWRLLAESVAIYEGKVQMSKGSVCHSPLWNEVHTDRESELGFFTYQYWNGGTKLKILCRIKLVNEVDEAILVFGDDSLLRKVMNVCNGKSIIQDSWIRCLNKL